MYLLYFFECITINVVGPLIRNDRVLGDNDSCAFCAFESIMDDDLDGDVERDVVTSDAFALLRDRDVERTLGCDLERDLDRDFARVTELDRVLDRDPEPDPSCESDVIFPHLLFHWDANNNQFNLNDKLLRVFVQRLPSIRRTVVAGLSMTTQARLFSPRTILESRFVCRRCSRTQCT